MSDNTRIAERTAREPSEAARRFTLTTAVDIVEDSQGVTLWADLPGVPRENLDVRVHDGRLSIEAQAAVPAKENVRLNHVEISEPFFARAFTLGDDFDTSKIDANLQNGVLKLTIPRREAARPRRIEVRAS